MSRIQPILFLFLLYLTTSALWAQPAKEIDWLEEIDLLGTELVKRHPNLFFSADSTDFLRALDRIAKEAPGHTVFQVSVKLQQLLASMGDAHTLINYHFHIQNQLILPVECYWFEDGLYILSTRADYADLLGKKIKAINHYPLQQVIDSLSTLIAGKNQFLVSNEIPRMITWTQLLQYFEFADTSHVELTVEGPGENTTKHLIDLPARDSEPVHIEPDSLPLGWQDRRSFFRDRYIPAEKTYYIQYNKCWSREAEEEYGSGARALFMPSFREFEKKVIKDVRNVEVDRLIFDLRFNGGGSPVQGTRFIKKLSKTRLRKRSNVYLIVGRKTSSSAIINAVDLMNAFDVVTVGEPTGEKPNHYGEVQRFVMPRSNMVVNCSTRYFRLLEEDPPAMMPDILVPFNFTQYMNGIDPAYEAIRTRSTE